MTRDQIITVAQAYAEAAGIGIKTASSRIFGDAKKLQALIDGGDLYTSRARSALQWLSQNWPDGADWPAGVDRPEIAEPAQ